MQACTTSLTSIWIFSRRARVDRDSTGRPDPRGSHTFSSYCAWAPGVARGLWLAVVHVACCCRGKHEQSTGRFVSMMLSPELASPAHTPAMPALVTRLCAKCSCICGGMPVSSLYARSPTYPPVFSCIWTPVQTGTRWPATSIDNSVLAPMQATAPGVLAIRWQCKKIDIPWHCW